MRKESGRRTKEAITHCIVASKPICAVLISFCSSHPTPSALFLFLFPGEDASLPLSSGGSYQILVNNVFYFTQRLVDKLWQGMFNKDSKLVVDFIVQLIGQVRSRAGPLGGTWTPTSCRLVVITSTFLWSLLQTACCAIGRVSSFFFFFLEPAASRWPLCAASTGLRNKIVHPPNPPHPILPVSVAGEHSVLSLIRASV